MKGHTLSGCRRIQKFERIQNFEKIVTARDTGCTSVGQLYEGVSALWSLMVVLVAPYDNIACGRPCGKVQLKSLVQVAGALTLSRGEHVRS